MYREIIKDVKNKTKETMDWRTQDKGERETIKVCKKKKTILKELTMKIILLNSKFQLLEVYNMIF